MEIIATRLRPGDDLKHELEKLAKEHKLTAGFVVTCVGSLSTVVLRMAGASPGKQDVRRYEGDFEIVSLVGTVSELDSHLHMSVSDNEGVVHGGHLKAGTIVKTTAEIVIGFDPRLLFERVADEETGFDELHVSTNG